MTQAEIDYKKLYLETLTLLKKKEFILSEQVSEIKAKTSEIEAKTSEIETKIVEIKESDLKIEELELLVAHQEEQLKLYMHRLFGNKSEKTSNELQGSLFDEAEVESAKPVPDDDVETEFIASHTRKKKKSGEKDIQLDKFPQEDVEYPLDKSECTCPECSQQLSHLKWDVHRELVILPAQVKVVNHKQEVCVCRNCEQHGTQTTIRKADGIKATLQKSIASAETLAFIMTEKYMKHMPLYRIESAIKQFDVKLSRQTMSNWMMKVSGIYLKPLYKLMQVDILQEQVIHADETPLTVVKPNGKISKRKNCYMWTYVSGYDAKNKISLYEYTETRGQDNPKQMLKGYTNYLQTDGYAAYKRIHGIKLIGCLAHIRRKFLEIKTSNAQTNLEYVDVAVKYCDDLFNIEKTINNATPTERQAVREKFAKPILDEFHNWLLSMEQVALPKSAFGKAIAYALNQWEYFVRYVEDGHLEISNNRAERSIKPFVMGRKNWLFSYTGNGATSSAIILSIIETAKANNLRVFDYLVYLLKTKANHPDTPLEDLLPYSTTLPKHLYLPEK